MADYPPSPRISGEHEVVKAVNFFEDAAKARKAAKVATETIVRRMVGLLLGVVARSVYPSPRTKEGGRRFPRVPLRVVSRALCRRVRLLRKRAGGLRRNPSPCRVGAGSPAGLRR